MKHIIIPFEKLSEDREGDIRKWATAARELQTMRFAEFENVRYNAQMNTEQIRSFCKLDDASKELLKNVMEQLTL